MIEYFKAVAVKATGTAGVTFLAGVGADTFLNLSEASSLLVGGKTAVVGAVISVVIPALNKLAARAAATKVPDIPRGV